MSYLKGFKKVGTTDTHTIMRHPNGHEIHIAHKGLDARTKKQMSSLPAVRKYATGGSVQKFEGGGDVQPNEPLVGKDAWGQTTFDLPGALHSAGNELSKLMEPIPGHIGTGMFQQPDGTAGWTPSKSIDQPAPASDDSSTPPEAPVAPPLPQAPISQDDSLGLGKLASDTKEAIQSGGAALTGIGAAEGQVAKDQAVVAGQAGKDQAALAKWQQDHFDALNNERIRRETDVANGTIDPNHYMASLDTPHKIMTGIGLFISGAGQSMHNTAFNPALEMLNKNIDRDIAAQQANLGIKKTLLESNYKQFGNLRDSTDMTRVMMKDSVATQMQAAALKSGNQLAIQQAQLAKSKWDLEGSKTLQEITQRQMMMKALVGASQSGNPDQMLQTLRVMNPAAAKEIEGRMIPGVGIASVPVDQKTRDEVATRHELDQKLSRLEQFAKQHQGTVADRAIVNQGRVMAQDVQDVYRRANGQGVFREGEAKFVNSMINADPTSFLAKVRTLPGYQQIRRGNQIALQSKLQSLGIKPKQFNSTKAGK